MAEHRKDFTIEDYLAQICEEDEKGLLIAQESYGDSWKKRGGVGAYMMLARKFDRIEIALAKPDINYDIFKAMTEDERSEGIIDDIRDLRRYLLLVESEMRRLGVFSALSRHRDNKDD